MLKGLADKHRIAVVVVQHLRKQFDSDPHNMVTGSTGLLGAADGSYVLKRENIGDKDAKLYIKGRDVEEQILNIRRDEETNEWIFISSDTPVVNSLKSEVFFPLLMNYLTAEKEFCGTASELSEKLGGGLNGNVLTRKLNRYEKELNNMGVEFTCSRTGKCRELLIIYDGNDGMTIETVRGKKTSQNLQTLDTA